MIVGVRVPEDFAEAFAQLKEWRAQVSPNAESTLFLTNKRALLDAAAENRWPTVHSSTEYAEAGGVIAYGADYAENCRSSPRLRGQDIQGCQAG